MKICITAKESSFESAVDPRFGRCKFFYIYDTETKESEIIDNSNADQMGGVGILGGELMSQKGVTALLTGNVGPNAFETLTAAKIAVYSGLKGTVKEAIDLFLSGTLTPRETASVSSHFTP